MNGFLLDIRSNKILIANIIIMYDLIYLSKNQIDFLGNLLRKFFCDSKARLRRYLTFSRSIKSMLTYQNTGKGSSPRSSDIDRVSEISENVDP